MNHIVHNIPVIIILTGAVPQSNTLNRKKEIYTGYHIWTFFEKQSRVVFIYKLVTFFFKFLIAIPIRKLLKAWAKKKKYNARAQIQQFRRNDRAFRKFVTCGAVLCAMCKHSN